MHTKLTLRLDERLIRKAKAHARRTGKSVSQLVANYFALLNQAPELREDTLPPVTRSLYGALASAQENESDYYTFIEEKHR
jgi:hypothetical protein